MEYQILHTTEYEYDQPVSLCHNLGKLMLRSTPDQQCLQTHLRIEPQPEVINEYLDAFGNKVIYFAIQQEHKRLKVTVQSTLQKNPAGPRDRSGYPDTPWDQLGGILSGPAHLEARQFIFETEHTRSSEEIRAYAAGSFPAGRPLFDATRDLVARIFHDFEFKAGFTTVATPLATVLKARKGVCQDFAHLAIACLRSLQLPARYVSGYIETLPPPGKPKLFGVDASHAWFSVYIPPLGWVDFDPTNNLLGADQHICIGWGRDYADITPLKGVILSSGGHQLKVSVDVRANPDA